MGTATDDGCTALTLAAGPMLIGDTLNELVTCLGLAGVRMEWLSDGGRVVGRSVDVGQLVWIIGHTHFMTFASDGAVNGE